MKHLPHQVAEIPVPEVVKKDVRKLAQAKLLLHRPVVEIPVPMAVKMAVRKVVKIVQKPQGAVMNVQI